MNALNLGNGRDHLKNVLWWAINLPLPSSMKNVVILCRTNNIPIDTPRDIEDSIIRVSPQKKSGGINVSVCGLIPRDECYSVHRVLINEVHEIFKHSAMLMALFLSCKIMDGLSPIVPSTILCSIKVCSTSSNKAILNWPSQYH